MATMALKDIELLQSCCLLYSQYVGEFCHLTNVNDQKSNSALSQVVVCLIQALAWGNFFFFVRSDNDDVGLRILGIIKSASFDMEEMRRQEKNLPPSDGWSMQMITFTR